MPADALPQPWATPLPGTVPLRRTYRDALGRPMSGTVTITGQNRVELGELVSPAAPVVVTLTAGDLAVDLQPDTYRLQAALRTQDGARVTDVEIVTLD